MSKADLFCRAEMPQADCNLCGQGEAFTLTQAPCMRSRGFAIADEVEKPMGRPPMQSRLLRRGVEIL